MHTHPQIKRWDSVFPPAHGRGFLVTYGTPDAWAPSFYLCLGCCPHPHPTVLYADCSLLWNPPSLLAEGQRWLVTRSCPSSYSSSTYYCPGGVEEENRAPGTDRHCSLQLSRRLQVLAPSRVDPCVNYVLSKYIFLYFCLKGHGWPWGISSCTCALWLWAKRDKTIQLSCLLNDHLTLSMLRNVLLNCAYNGTTCMNMHRVLNKAPCSTAHALSWTRLQSSLTCCR